MSATLGDTLRAYIKPSLNGEIVLRKRTSNQTSGRLKARQNKVAATKNSASAPARVAHDACKAAGKTRNVRVYEPGKGYTEKPVCPIKEMKSQLRDAMKKV